MNTTPTGLTKSEVLLPAALLVAADQNSGLDVDERMSVLEAVKEARNILRLPEDEPVPGAFPLDEDDADENPTTRAYRTILEASDDDLDLIAFDDEFLWNDQGGDYAVGIIDDVAIQATRHEIVYLLLTPAIEFDEHPQDEFFQAENPEGSKILWCTPDGSETFPDSEVWWIDSQMYKVVEFDPEVDVDISHRGTLDADLDPDGVTTEAV